MKASTREKPRNERRLIAVDPSLTCSGWALFQLSQSLPGGASLVAVGKIRSIGSSYPLATRLLDLQQKVEIVYENLGLCPNDVLICESQTTMRDPRAAFKVEQVRGIFETVARSRSLQVPGRINPRSVQSEIMGLRGKQLERAIVKTTAIKVVSALYGSALEAIGFEPERKNLTRNQDIVDAILVGSLAVSRLIGAERGGLSAEEVFSARMRRTGKRLPR